MLNDAFGDGAIVQGVIDILTVPRLIGRVVDHHINHDILTVSALLLFDADIGAQA
ncbi:hypothetical protein D3C76_1696140 [compost metagenome]